MPVSSQICFSTEKKTYKFVETCINEEVEDITSKMTGKKQRCCVIFSQLYALGSCCKLVKGTGYQRTSLSASVEGWIYLTKWFVFAMSSLYFLKYFDENSKLFDVYELFSISLGVTLGINVFLNFLYACIRYNKVDYTETVDMLEYLNCMIAEKKEGTKRMSYIDKLLICSFLKYINGQGIQRSRSNIFVETCFLLLIIATSSAALIIGITITYKNQYY